MQKLAWITDSTCGLSNEFIRENNIHVLPISVIVNYVSYKEDYECTRNTFYKLLQEHGEGATTSQPAFGKFINLYNKLKEKYDFGIAIHASSELTGTYESSIMAAKQTGFPVEVIDSKIDRKSTRLNSSHVAISYAVFCWKQKNRDFLTYDSA